MSIVLVKKFSEISAFYQDFAYRSVRTSGVIRIKTSVDDFM